MAGVRTAFPPEVEREAEEAARRVAKAVVLDARARSYDASRLPRPSWIEDLRLEHGAAA